MKKLSLLLAFSAFATALLAQGLPKKYVFLEHFTNSPCSVCASKNPAYYTTIHQYPNDVRNLSIYTYVPYSSCLIYKANPTESKALSDYYGFTGSPNLILNGEQLPPSTPLLPTAKLQAALNQTSPVAIEVQESGVYPTKNVKIKVKTYGTVPSGAYRLFAAVAESTVDYNAPNGEKKHYDVFRAMLPNVDGEAIALPAIGQTAEYNYTYTFTAPTGWTSDFDSLYVLAYIKNTATNDVLNAGTRFDQTVTGTAQAAEPETVQVQPNPATDETRISLPGERIERVEVFSISGSVQYTDRSTWYDQIQIPVRDLAPGIYLVRLTGVEKMYVGKLVRE